MASFKSVFFLLVILAAGGILLAAGETTGTAGDDDLLPTVITNNGTFELEMVCLYKHWLKDHGERTNYTLIEFEFDPRFLLFKSYFENLPVVSVPTLESRCTPRKDNSTPIDPPKDSGNGRGDHHNNSTVTGPPKNNGNVRDDQHNDDNDDKVDHQDVNIVNNCDNHSDGGDRDQQPKEKSLRDEVLHILSVTMMIVGIIRPLLHQDVGLPPQEL